MSALQNEIDSMIEEHGSEDGHLKEVLSDKGKLSSKQLSSRIKEIFEDTELADEYKVLSEAFEILNSPTGGKRRAYKAYTPFKSSHSC
jgi:type I restriction enzyme M protein